MKTTIKVEQEVDITTLLVRANVRYWEDAEIDGVQDTDGTLTPCRNGDLWCPIIKVDEGIISNWEKGKTAKIHFKVCDDGSYYLCDNEGNVVLEIEGDYVPAMLCPDDDGYGDYIIMSIDENGKIEGWRPSLDGFINDED